MASWRTWLGAAMVLGSLASCQGDDSGPLVTWGDGGRGVLRDAGARGTDAGGDLDAGDLDAGNVDGGAGNADAGDADAGVLDAGAVDAGPAPDCVCSWAFAASGGGLSLSGLSFGCGIEVCSGSGSLNVSCDIEGQPVKPSCGPRSTCTCSGPGNLQLACGDSFCGGTPGHFKAYSCAAGAVGAFSVTHCP